MNKSIFFLFFSILPNFIYSQQKNLFEAGIHIAGLELSHERNISGKFSIKTSVGYNSSIYRTSGGINEKKNIFVLQPKIKLQPRFYYINVR